MKPCNENGSKTNQVFSHFLLLPSAKKVSIHFSPKDFELIFSAYLHSPCKLLGGKALRHEGYLHAPTSNYIKTQHRSP